MKILIVDDDILMLEAIRHNLIQAGHQTIAAKDGFEALDILDKEKIELIISDLMMPNISGLGLLSLLKQFYYNKIPVIIISSLNKGNIIMESLNLGASDFITKPINFKELLHLVEKYENKNT